MSIFGNKEQKKIVRHRANKGMPGLRAAVYKFFNRSYLDIRIVRGRKVVSRLVIPDTGEDTFTVDGLGSFQLPNAEEMQEQVYDRHALYLLYILDSQKPGVVVENHLWSTYKFPVITPREFQVLKEGQTVSDLLAENEKKADWLLWLIIGAVALVAIIIVSGMMG